MLIIMHTLNIDDSNFKYLILDALKVLRSVFKIYFDEEILSNILDISMEEIKQYFNDIK